MDENPYKSPSEFSHQPTIKRPQQFGRSIGLAACVVIASIAGMIAGMFLGNRMLFGQIPIVWQDWAKTRPICIIAPSVVGQVVGVWIGWRTFSFVFPRRSCLTVGHDENGPADGDHLAVHRQESEGRD